MTGEIKLLQIPAPVVERLTALNDLVAQHPLYIPVTALAEFLSMDPASLRSSIDTGNCPFALGWQKDIKGYKAYKVPTVPFYLWYTQGVGFKN